jgi:hypothetical protein
MKYKRSLTALFLITAFFITNSKGMAMAGRPHDYYREKLKELNMSDGVSSEEAIIIAQNYVVDMIEKGEGFFKKLGIAKARLSEDSTYIKRFPQDWVILFPMSYGLMKTWNVMYVNKHTGEVADGGPIK